MKKFEEIIKNEKLEIPYSDNLKILDTPITLCKKTIPNRIAIQPMEGCDGTYEGAIDELTHRRYLRFAKSGAGVIWFEATAVANEGRANPRQLFLNEKTLDSFKKLIFEVRETAYKETKTEPVLIMQATHSGRYSKPNGVPEPLIAYNKPIFERDNPISSDRILSDDYLKALEEKYAVSAKLAQEAGFDGVDIKCCHGYLMSELMGAYLRKGEYGGSYENRTRLYFNAFQNAKNAVSDDFIVTSRINVYDGFPYPYGFGVNEHDGLKPDLTEPIKVIKTLKERFNTELIDVTIGNPYVNPHVNRPYNAGPYKSPEEPIKGVERMMKCVGEIQRSFPDMTVIGSAFSFMKDEGANIAAGAVKSGVCKIAGFGRQAFAYPEFYRDIKEKGAMDERKCCLACGKCTELMRAVKVAGCVIKDKDVYLPIYKEN